MQDIRETHDIQSKFQPADGTWVFHVARFYRLVCPLDFDWMNTPPVSKPDDIVFPYEGRFWSECTKERYIERLCIWSDGAPITEQNYRDAREAAWRDEGESNVR